MILLLQKKLFLPLRNYIVTMCVSLLLNFSAAAQVQPIDSAAKKQPLFQGLSVFPVMAFLLYLHFL